MGLVWTVLALIPGWVMRMVVGGVGVVAILYGAAQWQQNIGAAKLAGKLERNDNAAASNIRTADDLSRQSSGGLRDPNATAK